MPDIHSKFINVFCVIMSRIYEANPPRFIKKRVAMPGKLYIPLRVADKLLRKIGDSICVETDQGIKIVGLAPASSQFQQYVVDNLYFTDLGSPIDNFLINPDYLSDTYSLTGSSIQSSPHYALVETLMNGGEIIKTDYSIRSSLGTLDLRKGEPIRRNIIHQNYERCFYEIGENTLPAIKVIQVIKPGKTHYIIVDGKHRMAMALLLQYLSKLRVSLLHPDVYKHTIYHHLYRMLKRKPSKYSKNINLLEEIYGIDLCFNKIN